MTSATPASPGTATPGTSWTASALLGFDTETTGVNTATDRIVQAALVRRTPGACGVTTAQVWLIDPGVEIPDAATQVHGITTARLRAEGVEPAPALEEIATSIATAMGSGIPLVAFNASFDLAILEAELARYGLATLRERLDGQLMPVIDPLVLDRAADRYRKGRRTLADLMEVYRVDVARPMHAADVDTVATLDLAQAIGQSWPNLAQYSPADLHDFQVQAHRRWAESLNQWLASKGRTPDAATDWPLPRD